jgi:hypothetical protein
MMLRITMLCEQLRTGIVGQSPMLCEQQSTSQTSFFEILIKKVFKYTGFRISKDKAKYFLLKHSPES